MALFKSSLATVASVASSMLLITQTGAQMSDTSQTRLIDLANDTLKQSDNIEDLAAASSVLASLSKVTESVKTPACKRVTELLYREDPRANLLPSAVLTKATLYSSLGCETLSGVTQSVAKIVSADAEINLQSASDEELYAAYLLVGEAGAFGAASADQSKLRELIADRASNEWVVNFKPDKWNLVSGYVDQGGS